MMAEISRVYSATISVPLNSCDYPVQQEWIEIQEFEGYFCEGCNEYITKEEIEEHRSC